MDLQHDFVYQHKSQYLTRNYKGMETNSLRKTNLKRKVERRLKDRCEIPGLIYKKQTLKKGLLGLSFTKKKESVNNHEINTLKYHK